MTLIFKKVTFFIALLFHFTIFSLVTPSVINAQTLFSDNFEVGNATFWGVATGIWSVQTIDTSNRYGTIVSTSSTCCSETVAGDTSWTNYRYELDLLGKQGVDKNLMFRYINSLTKYGIHMTGSVISLEKHIPGSSVDLIIVPGSFINDVVYQVKIEAIGNNIKVFVNNVLYINYTDNNSPILNGKIGLRVGTGATFPSQVWFDNVVVTQLDSPTPTPTIAPTPTPTPTIAPTPTPSPLPNLDVPDIKQFTLPWGDDIYDSANLWSINPVISAWGCALTSASMVLRYYGHDVWPDSLNNWLKTQSDGYIRNGLINWLAVSRYTRINDSESSPTLEYRRLSPTEDNLAEQIENNRPGILAEPGHFVVAKSLLPDSFAINDPAYSDRPTLSSYSNSFLALGVYTPTHTDLSYIYLVIDANLDIKVFDANDIEIIGFTQIEEPIIDPENPSVNSGESVKTFMFPAPPDGIYKVVISGLGTYEFDSYIYDEAGNVEKDNFIGILGNSNEEFNLTLGETSDITHPITIGSIIKDLDEAYFGRLIKNRAVYQNIRVQLILAQRIDLARSIPRTEVVKRILASARRTIQVYTPLFINPEASNALRENLQILITSL